MKASEKNNSLPETKHEIDKIREYEAKGYTSSYRMKDEELSNLSTGKCYGLDDIKIVDEYRYEGMSNPSDLSILFVLQMTDGSRGLILRPYGPTASEDIDVLLAKVSQKQKNNEDRTDLKKLNTD